MGGNSSPLFPCTYMMQELMQDLLATKVVRVTGSYADGTENDESDIDFYVTPDKPEATERNFRRVMRVLTKHGIKCRSTAPGYVFTHCTSGNGRLPIQMEFSDLFRKRKNKLPTRELYGITFKTY